MYSEIISTVTLTGGPHAARTSQVKLMRAVKRSALRMMETFVERCEDTSLIAEQFVPAMLDPILGDYARGMPDARCAPVYSSFWSG
jgi:exportin-1